MGVRDVVGKVNRVEKSGKNLRDIGYDPFFGGAQFYNLSLNVRKVLSLCHLRICCNICQTKR